jgi:hypothetical protein
MKQTFIASISAVLVLTLKSDERASDEDRAHVTVCSDVLQLEAETVQQAADDGAAEARRRWPEVEGYTEHYAYARSLQITEALCYQIAEFALSMAEEHRKRGEAALLASQPSFSLASSFPPLFFGDVHTAVESVIKSAGMLAAGVSEMAKLPQINIAALMGIQPVNFKTLFAVPRSDKEQT